MRRSDTGAPSIGREPIAVTRPWSSRALGLPRDVDEARDDRIGHEQRSHQSLRTAGGVWSSQSCLPLPRVGAIIASYMLTTSRGSTHEGTACYVVLHGYVT